jgi:hypothetical protein
MSSAVTVAAPNYDRRNSPKKEKMDQASFLNRSIKILKAQQIMEEEQRLRLLQQDMLECAFSQQMSSSQVNNQILQGGYNPVDIERRNILVLQEELRRQEERRRAQEVLRATLEEQALLEELQQQAVLQQNATKQLLSQFAELDQLAVRQEAINSRTMQNGDQAFGARMRSSSGNNSFLNQQDLMHSVLAQTQNFGLDDPRQFNVQSCLQTRPSAESNILSHFANDLSASSMLALRDNMPLDLASCYQSDICNDAPGMRSNMGQMLSNNIPMQNLNRGARLQDFSRKNPEDTSIRYFNNGNDVSYNGDVLALSSTKKRKVKEQDVISDYCESREQSPRKKQHVASQKRHKVKVKVKEEGNSVHLSLSLKKNPVKLSKYLSSRVSEEIKSNPAVKNEFSASDVAGPHSDLIGSMFPQKETKGKKQTESHDTRDEKEDKLDAANVLLGLMKNQS